MNEQAMILVGHLQVMEEPLSSLYVSHATGYYYLAVRTYIDDNEETFVMSKVAPQLVLDYMEGHLGLQSIFSTNNVFQYSHRNRELCEADMNPIDVNRAVELLESDGLDDLFDKHLSQRGWAVKSYLKKQHNILAL